MYFVKGHILLNSAQLFLLIIGPRKWSESNNLPVVKKGGILDRHMPCPFDGQKIFCAGPNFLSHPKHLTAFNAFKKNVYASTKNNFTECKSFYCQAQNVCDCHNK